MSYMRYSPSVEQRDPEEDAIFAELSQTMQHITRTMATHYRHAYRPVHAKSHGVLVGTVDIHADLPEPLSQGLFTRPASHPVILRFSTNPGDLLADSVSSPRGLAIKILSVEGDMLPTHTGNTTQDFLCINGKSFSAPDPAGFLKLIRIMDKTLEYPEVVKQAVSTVARGTNEALRATGVHSVALDNIGHPYTHILGETKGAMVVLAPDYSQVMTRGTASGPNGEFIFRNLSPGKYRIEGVPVIEVRSGETVNITVVK